MLSDRDLAAALDAGELRVDPLASGAIQPASIDVRLGSSFRAFAADPDVIDPREPPTMTVAPLEDDGCFLLMPGEFILGATHEVVTVAASLAVRYEGKSSIGRLGIQSHLTAGFIDPGFSGRITLELHSVLDRPVKLWPGMAIGQLAVTRLATPALRPYGPARGSHYQGQLDPTPSRAHLQLKTLSGASAMRHRLDDGG